MSLPATDGKAILHTTLGPIELEFFPTQAPKACRNFIQLALEGHYNNSLFHRIVPNFVAQAGLSSEGKEDSIYDGRPFRVEIHSRLRFIQRGLVAMAGGREDNRSQFFITLDQAMDLQNRHTLFAKVVGDTIYNVMKVNEFELDGDRPIYPPKINTVEILNNPFSDIVPREKEKPQAENERKRKRKEKKNVSLLSFGDEEVEEEEEEPTIKAAKMTASAPTPMQLEAMERKKRKAEKKKKKMKTLEAEGGIVKPAEDTDAPGREKKKEEEEESSSSGGGGDEADTGGAVLAIPRMDPEQQRLEKLKEETRRMEQEIQRKREKEEKREEKRRKKVVVDEQYSLGSQRDKFLQKGKKSKKQREKDALAKLKSFQSRLKTTAKEERKTQKVEEERKPEDYCALHNFYKCSTCNFEQEEEEDDPSTLFTHDLKFEKVSRTAHQYLMEKAATADNDYEVYDPLEDPLKRPKAKSQHQRRLDGYRSRGSKKSSVDAERW